MSGGFGSPVVSDVSGSPGRSGGSCGPDGSCALSRSCGSGGFRGSYGSCGPGESCGQVGHMALAALFWSYGPGGSCSPGMVAKVGVPIVFSSYLIFRIISF